MGRLGGCERSMLLDVVLLYLHFRFPLWLVGVARSLSNYSHFVPADPAGAVCPGLATSCVPFLPLLRSLVDGEMPCCGGGSWFVASLVGPL